MKPTRGNNSPRAAPPSPSLAGRFPTGGLASLPRRPPEISRLLVSTDDVIVVASQVKTSLTSTKLDFDRHIVHSSLLIDQISCRQLDGEMRLPVCIVRVAHLELGLALTDRGVHVVKNPVLKLECGSSRSVNEQLRPVILSRPQIQLAGKLGSKKRLRVPR